MFRPKRLILLPRFSGSLGICWARWQTKSSRKSPRHHSACKHASLMHSALFQRLRTDVAFEIGSLEARLKQLLAEDYPTDAAPTLIRHLQKAAALQRAELEKIVQDSSADPDGALARLRSVHRKLVALYFPFVVYIQGAQTRRVPWS